MTENFDEDKFVALLDLAGPDMAGELTLRLDEDLSNVGLALTTAPADPAVLQAQSHILVSIAGTIGATKLFQMAKQFQTATLQGDPGPRTTELAELHQELREVILRVRSGRDRSS